MFGSPDRYLAFLKLTPLYVCGMTKVLSPVFIQENGCPGKGAVPLRGRGAEAKRSRGEEGQIAARPCGKNRRFVMNATCPTWVVFSIFHLTV